MESTCFGQFRAVLDSLGQFRTVKDGLNLVLDTVRPKPGFGRPKPNPAGKPSATELILALDNLYQAIWWPTSWLGSG